MPRTETVARNATTSVQAVLSGVNMKVFVSGHCGARGVTTGAVTLAPSGVLPYHTHLFSEAITLLSGEMFFEVEGRRYRLRPLDAIHIPANVSHMAMNASANAECICHAAFASDAPGRELVDAKYTVTDMRDGVAPKG